MKWGSFEMIKELFEDFLKIMCNIKKKKHVSLGPENIWELLASENKHDLIALLHKVEKKEPGYSSIIIPDGGFSKYTSTHKAVIRFLKKHKVNFLNVKNEKRHLDSSLNK